MKRLAVLAAASALSAAALLPARAHDAPDPQGVVLLSSSATVEVTKDLLTVVMSASREGPDAAAVQSQLKQALDAALVEARRAAKPGQLEVQTGNFSLFPRYDRNGRISGWQGSTELMIEGRDMPAIGALAGRIGTMTVARVSHGVSRELREKVEGDAAAQAIARFRAKAGEYAKAFGYAAYVVREVNVSAADMAAPVPVMAMRAKAAGAPSDEALPMEPGKGTVVISVGGSVQMTR
jgi:predicted secreted protein